MKIPRSTFYYQDKEKPFEELKAEIDLEDEIEKICLNWPRYGCRRVTKQLHREGWKVNHKRVLKNDAGKWTSLPREKTGSENYQQ